MREQFCLGDLKEKELDEILLNEEQKSEVRQTIKNCEGCSNPCEITREVLKFGLDIGMNSEEKNIYTNVESKCRIGDAILDYLDWYEIEIAGEQKFCWSKKECARCYIRKTEQNKYVEITYMHFAPNSGIKLEILINNQIKLREAILKVEDTKKISIEEFPDEILEVKLCVSSLTKPDDIVGNGDNREIGIGIKHMVIN